MTIRALAAFFVTALALTTPLRAQDSTRNTHTLPAGSVVRVETNAASYRGALLRDLATSRADTTVLRRCAHCTAQRIPLDSITALYVRTGSTRPAHATIGAVAGAVLGALVGAHYGAHTAIGPGHPNDSFQGVSALLGAAAGALVGGVAGWIVRASETWTRVPTPAR